MFDVWLNRVGGGGDVLPLSAVWVNRFVWVLLVAGQIAFAVVVGIVLANGGGAGRRLPSEVMVAIGGVMLAVGFVLAVRARRRGAVEGDDPAAMRRATLRGLILPMALLESASLFSLATVLVTGDYWPIAAVPAASLLIQLWLFPKRTVRRRSVATEV